jgi:hypothetical protein
MNMFWFQLAYMFWILGYSLTEGHQLLQVKNLMLFAQILNILPL